MKLHKNFWNIVQAVIVLVILLALLIITGYENFTQHRDTVVKQQQEHLLTIAKSVSRSLDICINDKVSGMSMLSHNSIIVDALNQKERGNGYNKHEEILQAFYKKYSDEMDNIMLIDGKGKLIYQYPMNGSADKNIIDESVVNRVLNSKRSIVGKEYESGVNEFSINVFQPIIVSDEVAGVLISTINCNKIYKNLIHPIRPGKKGYVMIKNTAGIIVMHPVTEQIGIESIKVRKEKYPEYDWKGLEELNRRQVNEGEGYFIYHSRWWQDNEEKLVKKINAYTTMKPGDIAWIISVQMDYSEIEGPIKGTLFNISLIALIITALLLTVAYIIFRIDKKRKALEIETKYLKELNKTWQELIKSEARLRHSQKLQTIGTLTTGIAHEFGNLLSPIRGYSEIILNSIDSENPMYDDITEINKSALRAKEIIDRLLVFSRNDGEKFTAMPIRIDAVMKESIKLIKSILPGNIKILENINSEAVVMGSAAQLQQVLLNLYTNSYHSMKKKGGTLEINLDDSYLSGEECSKSGLPAPGGNYVKIRVKDTGTGMGKETLNQIFDPFFTTKEAGEGTGLGLSVAQGILKNHGGSIIVDVGTTIDIYLPAPNHK